MVGSKFKGWVDLLEVVEKGVSAFVELEVFLVCLIEACAIP
jgi:hypothetical protein